MTLPHVSSIVILPLDVATVDIIGYFYAVDLGWHVRPQHHRVDHNLVCACDLEEDCPAATAVRAYLATGGDPAPVPRYGFYPVRPARCPVCGAGTSYHKELSSRFRGAGWVCASGGSSHYWQDQGNARVIAMREAAACLPA